MDKHLPTQAGGIIFGGRDADIEAAARRYELRKWAWENVPAFIAGADHEREKQVIRLVRFVETGKFDETP